ncbi:MAG: rRNA pseudouridine synthase [Planctomycetes bacterium]|nr:rRNA pseudouridine synthase [Planctomycetota bacterium]
MVFEKRRGPFVKNQSNRKPNWSNPKPKLRNKKPPAAGARPPVAAAEDDGRVRLNKYLADRGVGSRRGCDEVIASGSVTVNGRMITELGSKVDPANDRIEVNGKLLKTAPRVVYALNKPLGVVCTNEPRESRMRAIDLIREAHGVRLFCVGRLDMDSEGLILLTNDGEFTNRITHPRYQVAKSYFVKVKGQMGAEAFEKIRKGVWLSEGRTQGARVFIKKRLSNATVLVITIREGMNREIRRMFAKLGFAVEHLKRVSIGPLTVRGLGRGRYRRLEAVEIKQLLNASEAGNIEAAAKAAEMDHDSDDDGPDSEFEE